MIAAGLQIVLGIKRFCGWSRRKKHVQDILPLGRMMDRSLHSGPKLRWMRSPGRDRNLHKLCAVGTAVCRFRPTHASAGEGLLFTSTRCRKLLQMVSHHNALVASDPPFGGSIVCQHVTAQRTHQHAAMTYGTSLGGQMVVKSRLL